MIHFDQFIERHAENIKEWDALSVNYSLTIDFIESHLNYPWNWGLLTYNTCIHQKFIDKYWKYPWDRTWTDSDDSDDTDLNSWTDESDLERNNIDFSILKDKFVTPSLIEKYIDEPWDWSTLSSNQFMTPEFIERHIDKPWDWKKIWMNNFTYTIDREIWHKSFYNNEFLRELHLKTWYPADRAIRWCLSTDEIREIDMRSI